MTKKEFQANAVEGIDNCKERTKCGGAKDKEEAQRQLAVKRMLMMFFHDDDVVLYDDHDVD